MSFFYMDGKSKMSKMVKTICNVTSYFRCIVRKVNFMEDLSAVILNGVHFHLVRRQLPSLNTVQKTLLFRSILALMFSSLWHLMANSHYTSQHQQTCLLSFVGSVCYRCGCSKIGCRSESVCMSMSQHRGYLA